MFIWPQSWLIRFNLSHCSRIKKGSTELVDISTAYLSMLRMLTKSPSHHVTVLCPNIPSPHVVDLLCSILRSKSPCHCAPSQYPHALMHGLRGGLLCVLLTCQTQNRTTFPIKSGDGGHTLSLTGSQRQILLNVNLGGFFLSILEAKSMPAARQ